MRDRRARALAATVLAAVLGLAGAAAAQLPDPLLPQQWNLLDRATEPAGANVLAAWPTSRGLGVVIGIVDDGLQTTHPDLLPNLSLPLSFDFVEADADPNPRLVGSCNPALQSSVLGEGCHGTAVAGIAAARGDNGLGVSGVAPRATLAGLRLLGRRGANLLPSLVGDAEEALAIGFRTDAIHVKNFSFGPADDGATLERPGALAEAALQEAATRGRGGLGSVLVWAAGNGGLADNCNFDGYANSRYVIAAGALGDDALPAPYAEPCAALFVVTPSSGGFRGITTTDIAGAPGYDPGGGAFTDRFGGTSASAPTVSGLAALLLAANPRLTPRDVKHILVRTSVRLPGDFGWTPGMFPHSETLGFGLIDARAAVTAAATWTPVAPESALPAVPRVLNRAIQDNNAAGTSDTIVIAPTAFTVEHVEVEFDATHASRGDLEVTLVSPAGVASRLATVRPADTGSDFSGWRFRSVRHWGEDATGPWTLRVADRASADAGTWNRWTLRIFGTNGSAIGFVASGRVTATDGPLAGATLTFARLDAPGPAPAAVQTDAGGNWSQGGFVPGGTYRVTASRSGFVFVPPSRDFDASRNDLDFTASPGCPAGALAPGPPVAGTLAVTDCRSTQRPLSFADAYTFAGTAGQQVALTLTSTAFDTYLYLLRANGSVLTVLALNDDSGGTLNSRIPINAGFLTLPATETYTVEVTSFAASALGAYALQLTAGTGFSVSGTVTGPGGGGLLGVTLTFTRVGGTAPGPVQTDGAGHWSQTGFTPGQTYTVTPGRPGFTFTPASRDFIGPRDDLGFTAVAAACAGSPINFGQTVTGTLAPGDCPSALRPGAFSDRYVFAGGTAQQVAITLGSTAFDTYLYLLRANGSAFSVLALNDDSGGTLNSRIPISAGFVTLPAGETYTIEVTSFGANAVGAYSLVLAAAPTTGFRVAGQVTTPLPGGSLGLSGVTLTFTRLDTAGPAPAAVQTDAAGGWTQAGFVPGVGALYRVTPARNGFAFSPPFLQFGNTSAGLNFLATPVTCPAQPIAPGAPVRGTLAATDCVSTQRPLSFADRHAFAGTAGQQVAVALTSSAFDTYLYLLRGNGSAATVLAFNDDSGGTLNSRVPAAGFVTLPATDTYVIEATAFGAGATGAYTLILTSPAAGSFAVSGRVTTATGGLGSATVTFTRAGGGVVPAPVTTDADGNWTQSGFLTGQSYQVTPSRAGFAFVPPVRSFDVAQAGGLDFTAAASICAPAPITFGVPVSGALATGDCLGGQRAASLADQYTFSGAANQQVVIALTSTAFDTYLYLVRSSGQLIALNDDSGGTLSSRIPANSGTFVLPADDLYRIEATSFAAGATGAYTLSLTSTTAYAAGGRVVEGPGGLPGTVLTFSLVNGGAAVPLAVTTDVNGNWTQGGFEVGATYRVTPSRSGFVFLPPSREFAGAPGPLNFTATCPAVALALPQALTGMLAATDCHSTLLLQSFADRYAFTGQAGQAIAIAMTAPFDTFLLLFAPDGSLLAFNDDSGGTLNSRIPANTGHLTLPVDGVYTLEASSFAGAVTGGYGLNLTTSTAFAVNGRVTSFGAGLPGVTLSFLRVGGGAAPPAVVTDAAGAWAQGGFVAGATYTITPSRSGVVFQPASRDFTVMSPGTLDFAATCLPAPIVPGQTLAGALAVTDCRASFRTFAFGDTYSFSGVAGQQVAIALTGPFDTVLGLLAPDGTLLAVNDDSGGTLSSRIPADAGFLVLPANGTYTIEATSFGGGVTGTYSVSLLAGFSASGRVATTGGGLAGVTLSFTTIMGPGAAPAATSTDAGGNWAQAGFTAGTTYRVTPGRSGVVFQPASRDFTVAGPGGLDFTGSCPPVPVFLTQTIVGALEGGDCFSTQRASVLADRFTFEAPAGQQVVLTLNAAPVFDPVLYLFGPTGALLAANDDSGGTLNSRIPANSGTLVLPAAGVYTVEATAFAPGTGGLYTLGLGAPCTGVMAIGGTVAGSLATTDCASTQRAGAYADRYLFRGEAGQQIAIAMAGAIDSYLYLFRPSGALLAANDDSGGTLNSRIPANAGFLTLPDTGMYTIEATSFGAGVQGGYVLAILAPGSPVVLAAAGPEAAPNGVTAEVWTEVGEGGASGDGISEDPVGVTGPPVIAVDPVNGEIYAAWEAGGSDIHVKKFNGTAWVEVGMGSASGGGISNTPGPSRYPSIGIGRTGRPIVAWVDQTSGNWEIYVRAFNPSSGAWDPAGTLDAAGGGGISEADGSIFNADEGRPSLAAEGDDVFVAWGITPDVFNAQTHTVVVASLRPFTGWAPLAPNPAAPGLAAAGSEYSTASYFGALRPTIAIGGGGSPTTAYLTRAITTPAGFPDPDVHVRRWVANTWAPEGAGAAFNDGISGSRPTVPSYSLSSLRLVPGRETLYAAWLYVDLLGERHISVRQLVRRAGATWQPVGDPIPIAGAGAATDPAIALAVGADNLPIVAWIENAAVNVLKFSPIAGWHEVGAGSAEGGGVSGGGGGTEHPALAVDRHNNLDVPVLAWLDHGSGRGQVYARRALSRADLVVESGTAPTTGAAGQPLDVSAGVRNRGGVAAGPFSVGFFLSQNETIDPATDRLLSVQQVTGLGPGAQTTVGLRLTLPADVAPGAYFVAAFADHGEAVDEIDESNNGPQRASPVRVVGPDLVVTAINGPFTATPGQNLAVEVSVKNEAPPPGAAAASRVGIYLTTAAAPGTLVRLGQAPVGVLAPGASQTLTAQVSVPGNVSPGTYALAAIADEDQQVAESSEDNNRRNADRPLDVVRPDVAVTQLTAPAVGAPGQPLAIFSEVKNQAAAPPLPSVVIGKQPPAQPVLAGTSPRFRVNFYLSSDGTFDPGQPPPLLGGRDVDRLTPGARSAATVTLAVPAGVAAGAYIVVAVADVAGAIAEPDEGNNVMPASNATQINQPDLAITAVSGPPGRIGAAGRPLAVSVTVKNQAPPPAGAAAFRIAFFLSEIDDPGSGTPIGTLAVTGLAAGGRPVTLTGVLPVPATVAARAYFLSAVADDEQRIADVDRSNNGLVAGAQVTIGQPDLVLTRVRGPASGVGAVGQPLAVTLEVKNQAAAPASAGPFRVGVYLSPDSQAPGAGELIGRVNVSGATAGAAPQMIAATLVVPPSVAAGPHFLSAVADVDQQVPETDEANNGTSAAGQVTIRRADLIVSRITAPATGATGQPLALRLEVKNQAAAPAGAGPFRIGVYLSPDSQVAGAGTLIGNVSVTGLMAGGAPLVVPATLVVPSSIPAGSYTLSAVADVDLAVAESDETNNGRTADGPVAIGRPDLVITRVAGPVSGVGAAGQPLAVTAEVRNEAQAPAHAGGFRVAFFLAESQTAGVGGETFLGAVNVPALLAGARLPLAATFTVPANASAGQRFLTAVADDTGRVAESIDGNNRRPAEAPTEIRRPDLVVLTLTAPTTWATGQPFLVTATVRNQAAAPAAAGPFRVGAFLAPVSDPTARQLLGFAAVAGLAPQASSPSITVPVTVPPGLGPGTYLVSVAADHDDRVAESDESNNGKTAPASVQVRRADLAVTSLTGPATAARGRPIAVSNTVANLGDAAASAVRVSFFVSPVDGTPGAGRLIGNRDVPTLGVAPSASATSTATTTLTLPATLEPGSYYLSAVADLAGTVPEGGETNNGRTAAAQILVIP